jgi:NAD(P)-dependent dehydrogenase (short-subunit alcohol dehydrogenase family)
MPKLGEVVIITGGARGIGVEVVKKLLHCGMHVVIGKVIVNSNAIPVTHRVGP